MGIVLTRVVGKFPLGARQRTFLRGAWGKMAASIDLEFAFIWGRLLFESSWEKILEGRGRAASGAAWLGGRPCADLTCEAVGPSNGT